MRKIEFEYDRIEQSHRWSNGYLVFFEMNKSEMVDKRYETI